MVKRFFSLIYLQGNIEFLYCGKKILLPDISSGERWTFLLWWKVSSSSHIFRGTLNFSTVVKRFYFQLYLQGFFFLNIEFLYCGDRILLPDISSGERWILLLWWKDSTSSYIFRGTLNFSTVVKRFYFQLYLQENLEFLCCGEKILLPNISTGEHWISLLWWKDSTSSYIFRRTLNFSTVVKRFYFQLYLQENIEFLYCAEKK